MKRRASNVLSTAGFVAIERVDKTGAWGIVEREAAHGECTGPEGGGVPEIVSCANKFG